ncbi:MAG: acyltransferase, partial [Leucobacter sp.]|nr:acyltransferase [Leucobacter sp.]
VDVFFVISGFLITSHLIREAMRHGKVKLGAFWAARARRILPASLLTIGVTVGLTLFFAPVTQFETLRRQALASIFYVQNWVLARDAVDYSAAENDATPFQHFWTLSVEEQFYLFWPLLVLVGVWIVARKTATAGLALNERSFRAALTVLFGVVVLASLVYSILKVARGDLEAYFITTTRIWELGAGSMLAVVGGLRLSTAGRNLLTYLGLAAIVVSAFVLSDETPFPGLAAVPVIAGTIAVILAGTPDRDGRLAPLVRADPWAAASNFTVAQWIGDRSYSLYLWHFPVIILWPMIVKHPASWLDIVGMVVVALVLSDLSYRFIEQPVRKAPFFAQSTRNSLIAALLALLAIAGTTWLYPLRAEQATASWKELATETKALPELGAASIVDGHLEPFPSGTITMMPSPADAQKNTPKGFRGKRCVAPQLADVIPECISGDEKSDVSIALVGDSHARMYAGAIAEAAKKNGWRLRTYLKVSCPFTPTPKVLETRGSLVCTEPNAAVLDELLADPPDLVVTTWRFSTNFTADGDPDAAAAAGFASYWNTLEDAGIGVLVLRDVPEHQQDVPACVAAHYTDPEACTTPRDDSSLLGSAVLEQAIALAPRTRVADFTDLLCDQSSCKAVIGNVLAYRDKHHLTAVYARTMIPQLAEAIDAALPSGAR